MSNPFNYELDERRIKLMLQNVDLEYNEEAWLEFEQTALSQIKKNPISIPTPSVKIGINRRMMMPVLFILLIGGLSAILFSFVDFKKKEVTKNENSVSNSINATSTPAKLTETKNTPPIPKKTETTPQKASITEKKRLVSQPNNIPENKTEAVVNANVSGQKISDLKEEKIVENAPKSKSEEHSSKKKKRKKKAVIEEIPTINTTVIFKPAQYEPEPDLKID